MTRCRYPKPASPPARTGEPYTEEEILRAMRLHKRYQVTWPMVAERLERPVSSLIVQVHRYKHGRLTFCKSRMNDLVDEVAKEIIDGSSISEAARKRGLRRNALYESLKRRGWDQETIQEMRGEIEL